MPACTRERQGDKTLLDICLDVHMNTTGASEGMPPETLAEYVSILEDAARLWEPGGIRTMEFDTAVRWLIDATLVEHHRDKNPQWNTQPPPESYHTVCGNAT